MSQKLLIGLGNPGPRYAKTRHNAGFMALDHITREFGLSFKTRKRYEFTQFGSGPSRLFLLKPMTFMNLSGEAVSAFLRFHRIPPENIFVFMDDSSLPPGNLRVRERGSDGGHKGLRDICEKLGTSEIPRVRIGIGTPPERVPLEAYVLSAFSAGESAKLLEVMGTVKSIFEMIRDDRPVRDMMNAFNRKSPQDDQ